jgi:hypothetical protein
MDLTDEAGRASTRRADSALGYLPATTIADLAGTDTKVVFVARHQTTIGSRTLSRKTGNAVRVTQRGNTSVWASLHLLLRHDRLLGLILHQFAITVDSTRSAQLTFEDDTWSSMQ